MKKRLLVVGDSFMRPDPAYPGQHWSEMLPEYDVIMQAQSGSSNGIIAYNFYQALTAQPDAVVLGFTFPSRVEFRVDAAREDKVKWTTASDHMGTTRDQQLFADMFRAWADDEMQQIKDTSIARAVLSMLQLRRIPFAWTPNGLFNNIAKIPPGDPWMNFILGDFAQQETATNLATYQGFKTSPGFHTDDPKWQQRFASEVRAILQKSIDF